MDYPESCLFSQHVMKFAEMSQEVMIQRSQQVKFDLGLTPGRRRLGEKLKEEKIREEGTGFTQT